MCFYIIFSRILTLLTLLTLGKELLAPESPTDQSKWSEVKRLMFKERAHITSIRDAAIARTRLEKKRNSQLQRDSGRNSNSNSKWKKVTNIGGSGNSGAVAGDTPQPSSSSSHVNSTTSLSLKSSRNNSRTSSTKSLISTAGAGGLGSKKSSTSSLKAGGVGSESDKHISMEFEYQTGHLMALKL